MTAPRWTCVDDIVAVLRKRWERGVFLRKHAAAEPWEPIVLRLKRPSPAEVLDHFDEALRWARRFRRDSHTASGRPRFVVEHRTIRSRSLGANDVPDRVRIEDFAQLCSLLGTSGEVRTLDGILEQTATVVPALRSWVGRNPRVVIEFASIWAQVLATVAWILEHETARLYLRHVDVDGVDTKFIEQHAKLFAQLLTEALPAERVDPTQPDFARRFGFRAKPDYTRLRLLGPLPLFPPPLTELRFRTDELAHVELAVATVFIVENEISYLAIPEVPDSVAVFGKGFHVTTLEALPWLHAKQIIYWGDIDTYGFAILSRLRARFPSTASILMDRETLLAHPNQWVTELVPTAEPQAHLTVDERSLYEDLVEDRYGPTVRLEQERVRFGMVREALQPWL